jgi:hypothetical protein
MTSDRESDIEGFDIFDGLGEFDGPGKIEVGECHPESHQFLSNSTVIQYGWPLDWRTPNSSGLYCTELHRISPHIRIRHKLRLLVVREDL